MFIPRHNLFMRFVRGSFHLPRPHIGGWILSSSELIKDPLSWRRLESCPLPWELSPTTWSSKMLTRIRGWAGMNLQSFLLQLQRFTLSLFLHTDGRGSDSSTFYLAIHVPGVRTRNSSQQHLPLPGRPSGLCWSALYLWHCQAHERRRKGQRIEHDGEL